MIETILPVEEHLLIKDEYAKRLPGYRHVKVELYAACPTCDSIRHWITASKYPYIQEGYYRHFVQCVKCKKVEELPS